MIYYRYSGTSYKFTGSWFYRWRCRSACDWEKTPWKTWLGQNGKILRLWTTHLGAYFKSLDFVCWEGMLKNISTIIIQFELPKFILKNCMLMNNSLPYTSRLSQFHRYETYFWKLESINFSLAPCLHSSLSITMSVSILFYFFWFFPNFL